MKKIWILSLLTLVFFSCKKDDDDSGDNGEEVKTIKSITLEGSSPVLKFDFDEEGKLTKRRDEIYTYNEEGNLIKSQNSISGSSLAFKYDNLKRLIHVNLNYSDGRVIELSSIKYFNGYIEIAGIDLTTVAFFNDFKQIVKSISYEIYVDSGVKKYVNSPRIFSYDELGNLIKIDSYDSRENNGIVQDIHKLPGEILYSHELKYNKMEQNVFDLSMTMKGRTGQYDLSSLLATSTLASGPIDRISMFSKGQLLYDPFFESKERVYKYSTDGFVETVQMFSRGNSEDVGSTYLIEYY